MADTPATTPARAPLGTVQSGAPETQVGRMSSLSMDVGGELGQRKEAHVDREPDKGLEVNIDGNDATVTKANTDQAAVEKPEGQQEQPGEQGILPALPEFDAAKPEVAEAYDKAFLKEGQGGTKDFNMAALSADWSKNVKVDAKTGDFEGGLSESTLKWLETKGIDRATAKAVEADQVAQIKLDRQEVFSAAGGAERYDAALKWAKDGGYNDTGKGQFNAALNAGGAARKDAIDLLMSRYDKANPARRRVSPERTTADAATAPAGATSGAKPYANYGEYQKDLRTARTTNDQALLEQSRARLKASPWYNGK